MVSAAVTLKTGRYYRTVGVVDHRGPRALAVDVGREQCTEWSSLRNCETADCAGSDIERRGQRSQLLSTIAADRRARRKHCTLLHWLASSCDPPSRDGKSLLRKSLTIRQVTDYCAGHRWQASDYWTDRPLLDSHHIGRCTGPAAAGGTARYRLSSLLDRLRTCHHELLTAVSEYIRANNQSAVPPHAGWSSRPASSTPRC
jgi:hypothetical protein